MSNKTIMVVFALAFCALASFTSCEFLLDISKDVINKAPDVRIVTNPDPAVVSPNQTVELEAVVNDPEGDAVTFMWELIADPPESNASIQSNTEKRAQITLIEEGNYDVRLTVDDGENSVSKEITLTCTSQASNQPPTADAGGNQYGQVNTAVNFDSGNSSDPDGDTLTFTWDFGDGSTSTEANPSHTYTLSGTYTVLLTVTDTVGNEHTDSISVTIQSEGTSLAPTPVLLLNGIEQSIASGNANIVIEPDTDAVLDVSESFDPDGGDLNFVILSNDISALDGTTNPVITLNLSETSNSQDIIVVATDNEEDNFTLNISITVASEQPPVADAGDNIIAIVNESVSFDGSASYDPDGGDISSYVWQFGDSEIGTGVTTSHTYTITGTYQVKLTVTDDEGETDFVLLTVTINSVNQPPVASISGTANGKVGDTFSFSSSGSTDPEGGTLTYSWDFDEDSIEDADTESATFVYSAAGTYMVTLTISDPAEVEATATMTVEVVEESAEIDPVVLIDTSNTTVQADELVNFSGEQSYDPDGGPLTYNWDFNTDGTNDAAGATASWTYTTADTYTVTLTVTDDEGVSASATLDMTVEEKTYLPPTADAGENQVVEPDTVVTFNGSNSNDPDGGSITFEWDFGDGSPADTTSGAIAEHTYSTADTYTVTLTVTDDEFETATDTVQVVVSSSTEPQDPIINLAAPSTALTNEDIFLDASTSYDPDGGTIGYEWDIGDDGTIDSTDDAITTSFTSPGTKTIKLTVTDDEGVSVETTHTTTITALPVAVFSVNSEFIIDLTINETVSISLDASASNDPDGGSIDAYSWDFGNGNTATGATASYSYPDSGTYVLSLTVTDDESETATTEIQVTVNTLPVAVIDTDDDDNTLYLDVDPSIQLDGSNSTDPDGDGDTDQDGLDDDIVSWEWSFEDGATATGPVVTHEYTAAGTYTETLTVTDNEGDTASITVDITVEPSGTGGIIIY